MKAILCLSLLTLCVALGSQARSMYQQARETVVTMPIYMRGAFAPQPTSLKAWQPTQARVWQPNSAFWQRSQPAISSYSLMPVRATEVMDTQCGWAWKRQARQGP